MGLEHTASSEILGISAGATFDSATTSRALGVPIQVLRSWDLNFGFPRSERSGGRKRFLAADVRALAAELPCVGSPVAAINRAAIMVGAHEATRTCDAVSDVTAVVLPFAAPRHLL